jgi:hypothetical protein
LIRPNRAGLASAVSFADLEGIGGVEDEVFEDNDEEEDWLIDLPMM